MMDRIAVLLDVPGDTVAYWRNFSTLPKEGDHVFYLSQMWQISAILWQEDVENACFPIALLSPREYDAEWLRTNGPANE